MISSSKPSYIHTPVAKQELSLFKSSASPLWLDHKLEIPRELSKQKSAQLNPLQSRMAIRIHTGEYNRYIIGYEDFSRPDWAIILQVGLVLASHPVKMSQKPWRSQKHQLDNVQATFVSFQLLTNNECVYMRPNLLLVFPCVLSLQMLHQQFCCL